jgi:GTP cyclohydrolase I
MSWHDERTVVTAAGLPLPPREVDRAGIERAVRLVLEAVGEHPGREGLRETPRRVAEAYAELLSGSSIDPTSVLEALPGERGSGLIMVRDIRVASICEHHLLPFLGTAAVAYLPGDDGRICGISRLGRLIDVLSRRLQVQERLVAHAADALEAALAPRGVFVMVEAEHLCMTMRGARKEGSSVVTTEARGAFRDDPEARAELIALARGATT